MAHPVDGGDACTRLTLPTEYVLDGPEPHFTEAPLDLAQRLLLRCLDEDEFVDRAVAIADRLLERPAPVRARRFVDRAREAIVADPALGLQELAGETVSRYRNRVPRAHRSG